MPDTAAPAPLRFTTGARSRDTGVFYDESTAIGATSTVLPEAQIPVGDWLSEISLLVTVTGANPTTAATVAAQADAPWSVFSELAFLDAGGNTVHSLSGYNLYLTNLLGGFKFQSDPTASPEHVPLVTGDGAAAGSFSFILRVPVLIIDRDAIGAYPNGASNAAVRIRPTIAPEASIYSTAPSEGATIRVQMIETGFVLPSSASPAGNSYANEPPGAGTFQQWSQISYDLTTGRRTLTHTRKGQTYRTLIFVTRDGDGARSNAIVDEMQFRVDDVPSIRGPWRYLRHVTWEKHLVAAANLPAGVVQVSYAHEWDGKVGGELRDGWVPTQPGSKVEIEVEAAASGALEVITNEIVPVTGSGVLRV